MKRAALASCLLSLCLPGVAQAATAVYPGCSVPALKTGHHVFYVDPAKGSSSGDGSAAKPWKTLAEVLASTSTLLSTQGHKKVGGTDALTAINPNGVIKAGDVIMLMSGNHGSVAIFNAFNSDFVTVMAAPGQTPVISRLTMMSSAKWMFQGIKFQGVDPSTASATIAARDTLSLVQLGRSEWLGASSDIVFTSDTFSTVDDASSWSASDWLTKPYYYGLEGKTACLSVTNSKFSNLLNALFDDQPNFLAQNNVITGFSNDAIEMAASNVTLKGNTITGGVGTSSNPWHPDGIQGWSKITSGVTATNTNVLLDGNTIIKTGDPNVSFMQGISIFDGKWNGLTIQNNVIVTNHWHGIAVYGAQNLRIVNNTVVASEPVSHVTWIRVDPMKDGTHSSNVVVRNNISPTLMINDTGVTYDHNAIGTTYTAMISGKLTALKTFNTTLSNIIYSGLTKQFVGVDNTTGAYDLRLISGSTLLGTGLKTLSPSYDITGKARATTVSPGAYVD